MSTKFWHFLTPSPMSTYSSSAKPLPAVDVHFIWSHFNTMSLSSDTSIYSQYTHARTHARTHTRLTALFPGLPGSVGTRKVKPIWILLKQEIVSGSGISWAICKCAPCSRQITTPTPHHSVFYRPDALPAAQPTVSKH